LAFLNNIVGVFEAEIDAEGNVTEKVDVEYKGRQSRVILTTQGESTLKIFGE